MKQGEERARDDAAEAYKKGTIYGQAVHDNDCALDAREAHQEGSASSLTFPKRRVFAIGSLYRGESMMPAGKTNRTLLHPQASM